MRAAYGLLILSMACVSHSQHPHGQALFVRSNVPSPITESEDIQTFQERVSRQSEAKMDQTVQGILKWLQGRYNQTNRRSRQDQPPSRGYLPASPSTTQRPRPFQTTPSNPAPSPPQSSYQPPSQGSYSGSSVSSGYPFSQPSPVPTFNIPSGSGRPGSSPTFRPQQPSQSYLPSQQTSLQPSPPTYRPSQPSGPSYQPSVPSQPSVPLYQPSQPSYQPSAPAQPSPPSYQPSAPSSPAQPSSPPYEPSYPSAPVEPSPPTYQPSSPTYEPAAPSQPSGPTFQPSGPETPIGPSAPTGPGYTPQADVTIDNTIDGDDSHPPHIHEINVECAKDMMTINIEFDRVFNGLIYSKGHYNEQECIFVRPNSGQKKYSIKVMINSCGTQFVDQFSEGKQAYLENVLVLQNEREIQEVWDTTRSVRCYWEGTLKKQLSVALSVGSLSQETVTFSGDTATARLDIQLGRGPFAPAANGLVKIGETMTLVVTVEGDSAFSVLVRDCVARDNDPNSGNLVQLTDSNGCVLKPKLLGAFKMTKNPATNSVIAYAYFLTVVGMKHLCKIFGLPNSSQTILGDDANSAIERAFKFPDIMDLTIECNVELCKTECTPCPNPNQKVEPGRKRRSTDNSTIGLTDPISVGRRFRVFMPEDLEETSTSAPMIINVGSSAEQGSFCLSSSAFLISTTMLLCILVTSCISSAVLWLKLQRQYLLNYHK